MNKQNFDPSTTDDEVAKKTSWDPLIAGGTGNTTYKIKESSDQRLVFKVSVNTLIGLGAFIVIGLALVIKVIFDASQGIMFYSQLGLGTVFILTGILKILGYQNELIFDKERGYYLGEKEKPDKSSEHSNGQCRLQDIHAIQLLQERISESAGSSGSSSYHSFEMNLVLKNGERINVVDHGTRSRLRKDAQKVSQFLDVPVWDTITKPF